MALQAQNNPDLTGNVGAPIFLVGLPKSGISLLHNLLAQCRMIRTPELWEARLPSPPAGVNKMDDLRRIKDVGQKIAEAMPVRVASLLVGRRSPRCPASDSEINIHSFQSLAWLTQDAGEGYLEWLKQSDMEYAYRWHKTVVKAWSHNLAGKTWVFRDNGILSSHSALLRVYPNARIVYVRRDFDDAMSSFAGTMGVIRKDALPYAEYWRSALDVFGKTKVAMEIDHAELVSDPISVAIRILAFAGRDMLMPEDEQRMDLWLSEAHRPRTIRKEV